MKWGAGVREWERQWDSEKGWCLGTVDWTVGRPGSGAQYLSALPGRSHAGFVGIFCLLGGQPPVVGTDVQEASPTRPSASPPTLALPVQFDPS